MRKQFSLRHKNEYAKREYRIPDTCECTHGEDDHVDGGFWSRRECEICQCPIYERDKSLEGYYIECTRGESELSYYSLARGVFYLKKVRDT